jgi:hypothetical protein
MSGGLFHYSTWPACPQDELPCSFVDETMELVHPSHVKPVVVLILRSINHVEIPTDYFMWTACPRDRNVLLYVCWKDGYLNHKSWVVLLLNMIRRVYNNTTTKRHISCCASMDILCTQHDQTSIYTTDVCSWREGTVLWARCTSGRCCSNFPRTLERFIIKSLLGWVWYNFRFTEK